MSEVTIPFINTPNNTGMPSERVLYHTSRVVRVPAIVAVHVANEGNIGTNEVPNIAAIITGPMTVSQTGIFAKV